MKIEYTEGSKNRLANLIPENHPRMEQIWELQFALRLSWSRELCVVSEQADWTEENPAYGQCAITALVVDDYFPGLIYKDDNHDHYWNMDPENGEMDLDREQFSIGYELNMTRIRPRNELLEGERAENAKTKERYLILKERVRQILAEIGSDLEPGGEEVRS